MIQCFRFWLFQICIIIILLFICIIIIFYADALSNKIEWNITLMIQLFKSFGEHSCIFHNHNI